MQRPLIVAKEIGKMKKQGKLVVTLMLWGLLGFFVFSAAEPVAEAGPIWGFADLHNH